ncbi:hypothetical protein [Streptomyces sp. NPDC002520]
MSAASDTENLSAECAVARRPDYSCLHRQCQQLKDIPLPHSSGILLSRRCGCSCHRQPPTAS